MSQPAMNETSFAMRSAREAELVAAVLQLLEEQPHRACEADLLAAVTWNYT